MLGFSKLAASDFIENGLLGHQHESSFLENGTQIAGSPFAVEQITASIIAILPVPIFIVLAVLIVVVLCQRIYTDKYVSRVALLSLVLLALCLTQIVTGIMFTVTFLYYYNVGLQIIINLCIYSHVAMVVLLAITFLSIFIRNVDMFQVLLTSNRIAPNSRKRMLRWMRIAAEVTLIGDVLIVVLVCIGSSILYGLFYTHVIDDQIFDVLTIVICSPLVVFLLSLGIIIVTVASLLVGLIHRSNTFLKSQSHMQGGLNTKNGQILISRIQRQRIVLNKIMLSSVCFVGALCLLFIGFILSVSFPTGVDPIREALIDLFLIRVMPSIGLLLALLLFVWPWQLPLFCLQQRQTAQQRQKQQPQQEGQCESQQQDKKKESVATALLNLAQPLRGDGLEYVDGVDYVSEIVEMVEPVVAAAAPTTPRDAASKNSIELCEQANKSPR